MGGSPKNGIEDLKFSPFTVAIDTREQFPFGFTGLKEGAKRSPLVVRTQLMGLKSGDYSIVGHEDQISIERKSLEDLYGTLTRGRDRFERELERLQLMKFSAVVVEASWTITCLRPPERSQVLPKTIYRSILAYMQRYPRTHWMMCDTRRFAEITTYRTLERYWTDQIVKPAAESRRQQRISNRADGSEHNACINSSSAK